MNLVLSYFVIEKKSFGRKKHSYSESVIIVIKFRDVLVATNFFPFICIFLVVLVKTNIDVVVMSMNELFTKILIYIVHAVLLIYHYHNKVFVTFFSIVVTKVHLNIFVMTNPKYSEVFFFNLCKTPDSILFPCVFTISKMKVTFKYKRHAFIRCRVIVDCVCVCVFISFMIHQSLLRWGQNKIYLLILMIFYISRVDIVDIQGWGMLFRSKVGTMQAWYCLCLQILVLRIGSLFHWKELLLLGF